MVEFPESRLVVADILPLFKAELELCRASAGERAIVLTDPATNPNYAAACLGALLLAGTEAVQVVMPSQPAAASEIRSELRAANIVGAQSHEFVVELAGRAALVVDLTIGGMLHSMRQLEILKEGTRMLRIREPVDCLRRLFPTEANRDRVAASAAILQPARRFRIMNDAGTDLRAASAERPVLMQYGFAERPGRWDHWPTALVALAPKEDSADGSIVLSKGDTILFGAGGKYVEEGVRLDVRGGCVEEIQGGTEAVLLREFFVRAADEDARVISHIGWSCDPRADWMALDRYRGLGAGGAEMRSVFGAVVIAFGSNADLWGRNRTRAHVDLGLRRARFAVDDRLVLDNGKFLAPGLQ